MPPRRLVNEPTKETTREKVSGLSHAAAKAAIPPGRCAADGAAGGIFGEVIVFGDFGQDFFDEKPGVKIGGGIVFVGAVEAWPGLGVFGRGDDAGIDHDGDGDGDFFLGDHVVEDGGDAEAASAVLKDHDAGGLFFLYWAGT